MKQELFKVLENRPIARDIMLMKLEGDCSDTNTPGQFVNLRLDGLYLRRPISVCNIEGNVLTLIYKVVGVGTEQMARMQGGQLDVLTGLGNGYDLADAGDHPLLVGGGVGTPPLYLLARRLREQGRTVSVILGFNSREDVFYEQEFRDLGCEVRVTTVDGSYGTKGFVTDVMDDIDYTYFYTCGPEPMLRALYRKSRTSGQFSFEERMGCGFGACMGCTCETITGHKRICKEGPVLRKEEILWKD